MKFVKTCEVFLCFVAIVRVVFFGFTSLVRVFQVLIPRVSRELTQIYAVINLTTDQEECRQNVRQITRFFRFPFSPFSLCMFSYVD